MLASGGHPIVVSRNPIWPTLYWRISIWLSPLIVLAIWIYFVFGRLFLLDTEPLPALDLWKPEPRKDGRPYRLKHNIMVLGHPKSGKRLTVKDIEGVQILDLAVMGTKVKWDIPEECADVVALNHFEFQIDEAQANAEKLRILEELIYVRGKRVIILSTIDPLYYLAAGCPQTVLVDEKKDISVAIQLLDRWAAVLTRFQKVRIQDITENRFKKTGFLNLINNREYIAFGKLARLVMDECDHTAQLRKIGTRILGLRYPSVGKDKNQMNIPSREELVQDLLDRADSYYRTLWATCTSDERLVLYQLAQDGWANPKNAVAIQHLQRRRLITRPIIKRDSSCGEHDKLGHLGKDHCRPVGIRVMNESFRQFVCHSQHRDEIAAWEQEGEQSRWRFLKMSLGILAVAVASWLLYSQQQFFNAIVAYAGALGIAAGAVFKLVANFRGRSSAPSGDAQ
jgi:hypothetical protein